MKLVGDPAAEAWLEALSAEAFEWDSGNRSKNAKHQVEPSEVESLLQRTVFLAGRIVEPAHDEPRWLLLGRGVGWRSSSRAAAPSSGPSAAAPCGETKGGSMTKRKSKVRKKAAKRDLQVEEFESRDLGDDIRAAGGLRAIRKTLPTSIVLEQDLVDKLREKGAKRGLGYQTMLKLIAREHVDEY
ncbi:MAG: hypothetical protein AUH69_09455 [Actinobacteria bacterium 13_1_40CM_4_65_12]|nr:MAG: hypothetical protein AUH69_09455 [Actinobacteria bacterium 13_1_40CM_4_65_12]